jgi:serine protease AprX
MVGLLLLSAAFLYAPPSSAATSSAINQAVASYLIDHPVGMVSLIVETNGPVAAVEQFVQDNGGRVDGRHGVLNAFNATVDPGLAFRLNHDSRVKSVNLNLPISWTGSVNYSNLVNRYEGYSRIPAAWDAGYNGSEVTVAVIDTGVWPHADLTTASSKVTASTGNRLLEISTNPNASDALDHYGHGTHVAGIVAGNGHDSGGRYLGVAPNALIVGVKVSDDLGNANEGDVITGLEWVYQANQHGMHIKVINLSMQSNVAQSYHQSSLDAMVEKLWKSGVVVVVSAGNSTTGGAVNYAPGNDPFAITVGSLEDNYQTDPAQSQMASWALYGTTQDGVAKPDVVADGSHVVSLLAPASQLFLSHPMNGVAGSYFKMGGTSMASPQVAGLAALALQKNPDASPNQVKRLIRSHTTAWGSTAYTSWLGTGGGLADAGAVARADGDDNVGVAGSQSYDALTGSVLAGGVWWTGGTWTNVGWSNVGWSNVGWSSADFAQGHWTVPLPGGLPVFSHPLWSNVGWSNVGWSNVGWSNVGWSNVGWSNVGWSNVGWSNVGWSNVGWSSSTFG